MNRLGCMIAIASVCVTGCTASGGGSVVRHEDSGVAPRRDSGAMAARDAGATPPAAYDAGATPPAAYDAGATPPAAYDAGPGAPPPVDDGTGCTPDIVPTPAAAACAASTLTCIGACMDEACFNTCLSRDPDMAGCLGCMDDAYVACANAAGCQPQWDALNCCTDGCADPSSEACYTTTCAAENDAYGTCAGTHQDTCGSSDAVCFPR